MNGLARKGILTSERSVVETEKLVEIISRLSPDEQAAVSEFIRFIKGQQGTSERSSFLAAVDELIAEHPELLLRLAQ